MKWSQVVTLFAVIVFFGICIPSITGAYWCFKNAKWNGTSEMVRRVGWVLVGVAWCLMSMLVAQVFGAPTPKPRYPLFYVVVWIQGLAGLACTVVGLVMYLQRGGKK